MKKSIFTAALLVAGMATAFAAATSQATLTWGSSEVSIYEGSAWTDAFDNGYDAKNYNANGIAVINGGQRYSEWATNDLSNVQFDFGLTAAPTSDVVITVSGVKGDLYIDGQKLANGSTITLTAADFEANGALKAGKMAVSTTAPAGPEFCFRNEVLTVNGYAGKTLKISKDGTDVVAQFTLGDTYEYGFSTAAAGRYVVTFDGTDYQIDVKPSAVEVKP